MRIVDQERDAGIDVSVIVPVFNERDSLEPLFDEVSGALSALPYRWEVIFVDDGSFDGSFDVLTKIRADHSNVGVIQFRRNFGQTAALSAGFDFAHGEIVVTIDGDLQNDPGDIERMIKKLDEGFDIVSGWRHARKDSWLSRKLPSKIANALISRMTGVKLHDYGCTLKVYRREVIKNLKLYGEMHRFIPALANEQGANVTEMKVNHRRRRFGKSKYTLSRTTRVVLDLANVKFLLEYRTRPLQLFGKVGLIALSSGSIMFLVAVAMKLFRGVDLSGNPLLALSLFLFMAGIQLISIGLVGELVTRAYYETQGKSVYTVKTIAQPERGPQTPTPDEPQKNPLGSGL